MKSCCRSMRLMNRQMNMPQLQKVMMEFQKQAEMMDMKQTMFGDAMEDLEDSDAEEESEDIINQVLDEIGISFSESLVDAPTKKTEEKKEEKKDADALLEDRFK